MVPGAELSGLGIRLACKLELGPSWKCSPYKFGTPGGTSSPYLRERCPPDKWTPVPVEICGGNQTTTWIAAAFYMGQEGSRCRNRWIIKSATNWDCKSPKARRSPEVKQAARRGGIRAASRQVISSTTAGIVAWVWAAFLLFGLLLRAGVEGETQSWSVCVWKWTSILMKNGSLP